MPSSVPRNRAQVGRRVLVLAAASAALAIIMATAGPARASARPRCRSLKLRVALAAGNVRSESIWGQLCGAAPGRTVEVLTHGITYSHTYWDLPYQPATYSYVGSANRGGRATFAYDRIGIGRSTHPPAAEVTIPDESYILHEIVQAIRAGKLGTAFGRVVTVGHSLGSLITMMEAGSFHDVDGAILTGISHSFLNQNVAVLFPDFVPTQFDPQLKKREYPPGYLTTRAGTREEHFYYAPTADPRVVALDEATKETGTAAELATIPTALPFSAQITAPVIIIDGDRDGLICGTEPCSWSLSPFRWEHLFYGSSSSYSEVLIPRSGHDLALQSNAPAFHAAAADWLSAHQL